MNIRFWHPSARTTCRKAKAYLENLGADLGLRNLDTGRLSKSELDPLIGDRCYQRFLHTRNDLYRRRRRMTDRLPALEPSS